MNFELPYSIDVYFSSMTNYNETWFPAALIGWSTIVLALAMCRTKPRITGLILGVSWIWVGWMHQGEMMTKLNFMAPLYQALWMVEGVLLIVVIGFGGKISFVPSNTIARGLALGLTLIGFLIYPLVIYLLGNPW